MPALATIVGVLALIVLLARLRLPLALAIFAGAVVLCLVSGQGPLPTLGILLKGLARDRTVGLVLVTALQVLLSSILDVGGGTRRIVALCRSLLRRPALSMAALTALIGLLPMPGGALFSAPMVAEARGEVPVDAGRLSAINYWFRHVWEHWWPLYPGLILALALLQVSWPELVLRQAPLGICLIAAGIPMLLGLPAPLRARGAPAPAGTARRLAIATAPIAAIVGTVVAASPLLARVPAGAFPTWLDAGLRQFGPIAAGLGVAVLLAWGQARLPVAQLPGMLRRREQWTLPVLVATVMVFQASVDQLGMAGRIAAELEAHHIPLLGVIAVLPYLAGFATGLAVGFVGTSFPIVLPLAATLAGEGSILPWAAMAYCFGHLGQMSSPIHLCMVVSNRYFGTSYGPLYRHVLPALLGALALSCAWLGLLVMIES